MGSIEVFKRAADAVLLYLLEKGESMEAEWTQLGLSRNTVAKIRAYLEESGYIERGDDGRYRLTAAGLAYVSAGRGLSDKGMKILDFLFTVYPGKAEIALIASQTGIRGDDLKTVLKILEAKGYIELEGQEGEALYGYARLTSAGIEALTRSAQTRRKVRVW